jgi:hypothetical protein
MQSPSVSKNDLVNDDANDLICPGAPKKGCVFTETDLSGCESNRRLYFPPGAPLKRKRVSVEEDDLEEIELQRRERRSRAAAAAAVASVAALGGALWSIEEYEEFSGQIRERVRNALLALRFDVAGMASGDDFDE